MPDHHTDRSSPEQCAIMDIVQSLTAAPELPLTSNAVFTKIMEGYELAGTQNIFLWDESMILFCV